MSSEKPRFCSRVSSTIHSNSVYDSSHSRIGNSRGSHNGLVCRRRKFGEGYSSGLSYSNDYNCNGYSLRNSGYSDNDYNKVIFMVVISNRYNINDDSSYIGYGYSSYSSFRNRNLSTDYGCSDKYGGNSDRYRYNTSDGGWTGVVVVLVTIFFVLVIPVVIRVVGTP